MTVCERCNELTMDSITICNECRMIEHVAFLEDEVRADEWAYYPEEYGLGPAEEGK